MILDDQYQMRFGGIERLYGKGSLERLFGSHVAIVGVGGVGSWSAEALIRSGIGEVTLIDLDEICITNTNRQLHTLHNTIGQSKVHVLAQRLNAIHPQCQINAIQDFFTPSTEQELLEPRYDYVIDAIDSLHNKVRLIKACRNRGLPLVTIGGAGGRRQATSVVMADLAESTHDGLLRRVRKILKAEVPELAAKNIFGIPCVFSRETALYPAADGTMCERPSQGDSVRLNCESGLGAASFVTGTFGFAAAAHVVSEIVKQAKT